MRPDAPDGFTYPTGFKTWVPPANPDLLRRELSFDTPQDSGRCGFRLRVRSQLGLVATSLLVSLAREYQKRLNGARTVSRERVRSAWEPLDHDKSAEPSDPNASESRGRVCEPYGIPSSSMTTRQPGCGARTRARRAGRRGSGPDRRAQPDKRSGRVRSHRPDREPDLQGAGVLLVADDQGFRLETLD